jgi:hypothetical protein
LPACRGRNTARRHAAEALAHYVLQKAMNENDIATCEFVTAGHPLLDELAMVADELEVKMLHPAAGIALAGCCLLYVAEPLSEGEVRRLNGVLEQ